jgi:PAS domain-containing protein
MSGQEFRTVPTPPGLDVFRKVDQSALDAIPTGLCVCRSDGSLVRYNRRAVELWGRTPPLEDPSARDGLSSAVLERMAPLLPSIPRLSLSRSEADNP